MKLRGNDSTWDYERLVKVGRMAVEESVNWLTADFNCTVMDPAYVNDILDRLVVEHPRISGMILYVEQPFPYDLEEHRVDVRSVSARKPLFMDESAHDWRFVKLGRELGWSGVALKTCKTQTGALLSLCWAKAHGMTLMVQDLTNPMLAQKMGVKGNELIFTYVKPCHGTFVMALESEEEINRLREREKEKLKASIAKGGKKGKAEAAPSPSSSPAWQELLYDDFSTDAKGKCEASRMLNSDSIFAFEVPSDSRRADRDQPGQY